METSKHITYVVALNDDGEQFQMELPSGPAMVYAIEVDRHNGDPFTLTVRAYGMKKDGSVGNGRRASTTTLDALPQHLQEILVRVVPGLSGG